jgi:hypothetical protein
MEGDDETRCATGGSSLGATHLQLGRKPASHELGFVLGERLPAFERSQRPSLATSKCIFRAVFTNCD